MSFISPFTNILGTNYVPTPIEMDTIERILDRPCAELRALENQLLQLKEQLETKKEIRDDLSRSIDEHRSLLSPFRYLPDDILSEIFMACLPTTHEAIIDPTEPPLILGYICRRWRTVAYHTPRLWATLHIAIPTSPKFVGPVDTDIVMEFNQIQEQRVRHHQARISTWLSRSKTCPLSISIHDPFVSAFSPPDSLPKSYYELMYGFSAQIRRLNLTVLNQHSTSDLLATFPSSSFSQLRVFLVKFHRYRRQILQIWPNSNLLNIPNLICLSISHSPLSLDKMVINWSHLTHILVEPSNLQPLNIADAQKIFTHCPQLRFCAIDLSSLSAPLIRCTPFSLPYLHTLSIIDGSISLGDLFQYADIPSLRNLTYHTKLLPESGRRSPLLVILSRTHLRLERLTANIQFFTLADVLECFDMTPSLTHFISIPCSTGYSSPQHLYQDSLPVTPKMLSVLLYFLTPARDRPLYLPNLQVIKFDSDGLDMEVSDRELLNFIQRRMESASLTSETQVAALTEIFFVSADAMEIDIRAELADYVAKGMKLHLTYYGFLSSPLPLVHPRRYNPDTEVQTWEVDEGGYL